MVSQLAFSVLVGAVGIQRIWELRISAENEARLRARGAVEVAAEQVTWMRLLHGAWLAFSLVEVWLLGRPFLAGLAVLAGVGFVAGQGLRLAAMRALGSRWNVRILVLPGEPLVRAGIFRYMRHPNYSGVVIELVALPLMHSAWLTAVVFSVANLAFLRRRVGAEEAALREAERAHPGYRASEPAGAPQRLRR